MRKKRYIKPQIKSSKVKLISFYGRGSIGSIDQSEFLLAANISGISDKRVKSKITELESGLKTVLELRPKSYLKHEFRFKGSKLVLGKGKKEFGLIAQEIHKVLPQPAIKPKDKKDVWRINYAVLVPVLVKAVQEQQKEIDSLKRILQKRAQSSKKVSLGLTN